MRKFNTIRQILVHETRVVLTDHSILLTVIIAPLLYAFFLGSIYVNKDIDQIRFAVVDYDNTPTTREMTRLLSANPKIELVGYLEDYQDGVDKLNNLEVSGFIIFTKGFENKVLRLEGADVNLYLNNTRFLPSNDLNMAVNKVMLTIGAGIRLRYFEAKGIGPQYAMEMINPVSAEVKPIYNNVNSYGNFLLPGLFFLILQQTLLLGLGESIGRDSEKGYLIQWIHEGKHGVVNYLFGKTGYYAFLYVAYLVLFVTVIFPYFDLPVLGSMVPIMVVSSTFLVTIMVYAMLIGSFVKSQIKMMEILAFTTYPFFLLSGYSWPLSEMPLPLQWLSATVPTTPMLEAMTKLFVMGGDWNHVLHNFQHLVILLIISLGLLIWRLYYIRSQTVSAVA